MTRLRDIGSAPRTTLEDPQAEMRLEVGWGDIPGRPVLYQTVFFDGTPDGFDEAIEEMKVAFRKAAAASMRPCGYAGPWHESLRLEDRLVRPDDDRDPQGLS